MSDDVPFSTLHSSVRGTRNPKGRPLVILAGWLGSKRRHLDRYAKLYQSLDFNCIIAIASPSQVVLAATKRYDSDATKELPISDTVQHLARSIINDAYELNPSYILFHVFSNGGAFVWEAVRFELMREVMTIESKNVKDKLSGIVFDSAPANHSSADDLIYKVLDYCTDDNERLRLYKYLDNKNPNEITKRKQRSKDFWTGLQNCSFSVPHLYIFSKDDKLTPHSHLIELIHHRERLTGKMMTRCVEFESSPHCQHFLHHEDDYKAAVMDLITFVEHHFSKNNNTLSRL